jgi:hypothetical protein
MKFTEKGIRCWCSCPVLRDQCGDLYNRCVFANVTSCRRSGMQSKMVRQMGLRGVHLGRCGLGWPGRRRWRLLTPRVAGTLAAAGRLAGAGSLARRRVLLCPASSSRGTVRNQRPE